MNENVKDFTRLIVKFFGVALVSLSGMVSSISADESNNVILNSTIEWSSPAGALIVPSNPFTPLCTHKGSTYYVWMDAANRPWVTKLTGGTPKTVPLDNGTDYTVQPDGHHRFSMGIDKNGYIHITGDMHHYTYFTIGVINPYPARYQKQGMLYWKSNQPNDVTSGFTFSGGLNSATTMPGTGWLLGHFFNDNHGELYYTSQMHAIEAGNYPGENGLGLYKYDAAQFTWTALGGLPDNTRAGSYNKCLYWENSGVAPTSWFQGFEATFKFDPQNRLHMAVVSNTDSTIAGSNRILYAVSDDSGVTWSKANGVAIPGVPLRGAKGTANLADVVADAPVGGPYYGFETGLAVDKHGQAVVCVDNVSRSWNGTAWTTTGLESYTPYINPMYGYLNPDQNAVLLLQTANKIVRTDDFNSTNHGYDYSTIFPNIQNFFCVDEEGLKTTGIIRGITVDKTTNVQNVVKTVVTRAPLPEGWFNQDISATPFPYAGTAGYYKGTFATTDYGSIVGDNSDSFHYVYKTMTGDGSIVARVTAGLPSPQGFCRSGIMMRAHLSPNSQFAAVLIAPGTQNQGAIFTNRQVASGGAWGNTILAGTVPATYWTKLVRAGNTFTGFVSPDGATWTQVGQGTFAMPNTIYVGLAPVSYANKWFMQVASYDNVTVTP